MEAILSLFCFGSRVILGKYATKVLGAYEFT
jgi:uncharacterized membrane protein